MSLTDLQNVISPAPGFYGTRMRAFEYRDRIENLLDTGADEVTVALDGVFATQSFIDELIGVLIVQRGPSVASRLKFKGCSSQLKQIISFVLNDRIDEHEGLIAHH